MAAQGMNYDHGMGTVQSYSRHYRPRWCDILGVEPTASKAEISAAYRGLAKIAHPDHGGSEDKMKELNATYAAALAGMKQ